MHDDTRQSDARKQSLGVSHGTCEVEAADGALIRRPPHRELFSNPATSVMWEGVKMLEEGDLIEFAERLIAYVAVPEARGGPRERKIARGVQALREAQELRRLAGEEGPLTAGSYRQVRKDNPELLLPPDGSVRNWLGGRWNDALRAARLDAASGCDSFVIEARHRFMWEETRAAVAACIEDLREPERPDVVPNPSFSSYLAWERRPDVRRRPGRRPRDIRVFGRFGGWLAVKNAVLRGEDPPRGADQRELRTGMKMISGRAYTEAELIEAILLVRDRLGRVPRSSDYEREREAILEAELSGLADDTPRRAMPSYGMLIGRYGSWDVALAAAGLEPFSAPQYDKATGLGFRTESAQKISDDDLVAGVREAYEALGPPFGVKEYQAYRKQQGAQSKGGRRLASYAVIYERFGGFGGLLDAAEIDRAEARGRRTKAPLRAARLNTSPRRRRRSWR